MSNGTEVASPMRAISRIKITRRAKRVVQQLESIGNRQ